MSKRRHEESRNRGLAYGGLCSICGEGSPSELNNEARLSCADCTVKLHKHKRLSLLPGDIVWCGGFGPSWPARVAMVSFTHYQDACPYFVEFFGVTSGAWVAEGKLTRWGSRNPKSKPPATRNAVQRKQYIAALAEANEAAALEAEVLTP